MTVDAYLVIRCDAEDPASSDGRCDTEHSWPTRVENHTELRRLLRSERGWHRPRPGRDVCPGRLRGVRHVRQVPFRRRALQISEGSRCLTVVLHSQVPDSAEVVESVASPCVG
ncbi:hypothetical protein FNJ62_11165 [Streptomyces benahoarensis]|uniref:Uncharacterized protein n=1 Tax=Streptomyces benahoarensis TaxID=2595054 RepID=A0A553ZNT8_9ACTN|nr:hypothetical protein FNJ62_11165 [Streptomyces benahoarensis]TSB43128.1 hypothetical protein FNZ23_06220 [Streptomyces benahoarensis]